MSVQRLVLAAATLVGSMVALAPARAARAQDLAPPPVENSKNSFEGVVNAPAVFVRSGPGETYYPTLKLDKGTKVTVVGIKFNWLKVQPPAGSFSYVSQAFVQRRGDGKVGRVTNTINVRAGSDLVGTKTTLQTKLEAGTDVQIIGTQDEYYKVVPPDGAYLYIDQRFVDPVRRLPKPGEPAIAEGNPNQPEAPEDGNVNREEVATQDNAGTPATNEASAGDSTTTAPTTVAAASEAQQKFDELEVQFQDASAQPVGEQPLDAMIAGYQELAMSPDLTNWLKRAVDARLKAVQTRKAAAEQFAAVQKKQQELVQQRKALVSEQEELEERIQQTDVKVFTAVGLLRTSSLQLSPETLFRLTDPQTGRTVVYIRSADAQLAALLNQFIGIRGTMGADPQLNLRVIDQVQLAEAVDQTKVNGSVAATVVPPSLLPRVPTADASREQGGATEPQ